MKSARVLGLSLFLGAALAARQEAAGSGTLLEVESAGCYGAAPKSVTFTPARTSYVFGGACDLAHTRLHLPITVPWTGTASYEPATGRAIEDITVPAPLISQPSRPYGRFQASMHCPVDPWVNVNVICDSVAATANAPMDHTGPNAIGYKQPFRLEPEITGAIQRNKRPYTSFLEDGVRATLLGRLVAAMKAEQLRKAWLGTEVTATGKQAEHFRLAQKKNREWLGTQTVPAGNGGKQPAHFAILAGAPAAKPAPKPEYGATYAPLTTPSVRSGQSTSVQVKVTNGSSQTWPAGGLFRLAYHWYQGAGLVVFDGDRTFLAAPVSPGGTVTLNAKLTGPPTQGAHTLKWDMVHENKAWFSNKGVPTKDQAVTVTP